MKMSIRQSLQWQCLIRCRQEQLREMMGERGVAMVAEDILSKQALEFIVKEAVEA